jgi:hypothetical protein
MEWPVFKCHAAQKLRGCGLRCGSSRSQAVEAAPGVRAVKAFSELGNLPLPPSHPTLVTCMVGLYNTLPPPQVLSAR